MAFVMLTTMISSLFGLIDPAMTRIFYERLLSGKARNGCILLSGSWRCSV